MSQKRINKSRCASIDKSRIFASGTFKNVWSGRYTDGARNGERCVSKEFKMGSVVQEHFFEEELKIIRHTQRILDTFHKAAVIQDRNIILNTPEIWTYQESGHKNLVEPMIENFEKFNSNTGWTGRETVWSDAMQALSHFSYHISNGHFLLCDLQGGSYRNGYILSDPVIMSQDEDWGPADLGPRGIKSFFQRHRCGRFCNRQWIKPDVTERAPISMQRGTMMIPRLPTRGSRNPLARLQE